MTYQVDGPSMGDIAALLREPFGGELAEALAEESLALVLDGFTDSVDPYGVPWAPLVIRDGQPLVLTAGMRNSFTVVNVSARGFAIASGKSYTVFHRTGTGIHGPRGVKIRPIKSRALKIPGLGYRTASSGVPARRMVPDDGDLPQLWVDRFDEAAADFLDDRLGAL